MNTFSIFEKTWETTPIVILKMNGDRTNKNIYIQTISFLVDPFMIFVDTGIYEMVYNTNMINNKILTYITAIAITTITALFSFLNSLSPGLFLSSGLRQ